MINIAIQIEAHDAGQDLVREVAAEPQMKNPVYLGLKAGHQRLRLAVAGEHEAILALTQEMNTFPDGLSIEQVYIRINSLLPGLGLIGERLSTPSISRIELTG